MANSQETIRSMRQADEALRLKVKADLPRITSAFFSLPIQHRDERIGRQIGMLMEDSHRPSFAMLKHDGTRRSSTDEMATSALFEIMYEEICRFLNKSSNKTMAKA